ncbi:hypothetical protein I6F48_00245 [Pseudoalteromonas sp. SWYJ118]|uniref:hypothetical protein n=1 Tax=Pseudoalteromonas sp. SWYJ118 TaxID=2792062 RepID=UPI0018CEE0AF|nr:hypothetical protein [Pseudoalteromonas sp. SWYJ118]MBH0073993.1 hypothetical protein [Pseudoalteromonas sp. SWYJ118]
MFDLSWFLTPTAAAIAWVCTVIGVVMALFQSNKKNTFKVKCENLEQSNISLKQEVTEIQKNNIQGNSQTVEQTGKNNFNTGVMTGDLNIN